MKTIVSINEKSNLKRSKILTYLNASIEGGRIYFKSKYIAKDLNLSTKEVGVLLGLMSKEDNDLEIQKWGISRSVTWKIEQQA